MSQLVPYDPDFDQPQQLPEIKERNIFDALSPKYAFVAGIFSTVAIVCTVGFFILLSLFLRGGTLRSVSASTAAPSTAVATALKW